MIRILTSLAALLTISSIQATTPSGGEPPKLVVGITVDQLRGDYLHLFQDIFTEGGFKRLLNEGLVYQNMQFNFPNVNTASAIATIYTGTTPAYHGITSPNKYDTQTQREVSIYNDENYIGNYTQDKVSPLALNVSTITDELKIASWGRSEIYSFAPDMAQALTTAGNKGNGAYWVEDYSGQWASSTYYKNFYWSVDQENRNPTSHAIKAWNTTWYPILSTNKYISLPYGEYTSFAQQLGANKDTYKLYKQSPLVNESITNMALTVMGKSDMGKRTNPDFLSLTLYAGAYNNIDNYSLEIQDTYVRLDRDIERLLNTIDEKIGLKNTVIFLTSTGYYNSPKAKDNSASIDRGIFYPNRCEALLNMYLMAIYGRDSQWVSKYYDNQIYLNRELIKQKEIPLAEIQDKAATFVSEFSGVQNVYTIRQLENGTWNPRLEKYRNGINKQISGDIFVELKTGYTIIDEQQAGKEKYVRNDAIASPVIFFGKGIKPQKVGRTITATEIAPSISQLLRIRAPDAATESALPEIQ